MSKVIKSQHLVETIPCLLEPADCELFFIDEPEEEQFAFNEEMELKTAEQAEEIKAWADKLIAEANQERETILAKTKSEVELLINNAKQQANQISNQAQNDGFQRGYQLGLEQAKKELYANLARSLELVTLIENERMERIASSEPELAKLSVAIAEKIINAELKLKPSQILKIVRAALERVENAYLVTIKVKTADKELLNDNLPQLQTTFSVPQTIKFESDDNLNRGDFLIETEQGKVDARVKTQLELITTELLKAGRIG